MNKFESYDDGIWLRHVYPRVFLREKTTGTERLQVGIPPASDEPIRVLLALLSEPLIFLYVLHTPHGGEPGRYQSPSLNRVQAEAFLDQFGEFFMLDARHDLWVHSPTDDATLVWDRHDILYAYGPLTSFATALKNAGYQPGDLRVPIPHAHHYHSDLDSQQEAVLKAFDWRRTELQPEDQQFMGNQ